ncbi:MAG: FAD binding domain-containing protein [Campylobacterota bacterium]|nr:FAD binding domain-containing protein [Campylobacterota bacterium]
MIYLNAKNLKNALLLKKKHPNFFPLCGSSDISLKLRNNSIDGIIDISHLSELNYIDKTKNTITIGASTTINSLLENSDINRYIPILADASKEFASHQVRNIASIGGNIANDSPVADLIAPLLVLDAKVNLLSSNTKRTIFLHELLIGFKSLDLNNEIIISLDIPIKKAQHYYRKVGARAKLNIAKLSLAMIRNKDGFFISGASLNPYVKRFSNLETLLNSGEFNDELIKIAIDKDISPSGSFRSTKEYRSAVLFNLVKDALGKFE